jgi:hypothetical protein
MQFNAMPCGKRMNIHVHKALNGKNYFEKLIHRYGRVTGY